jgi:uncharacterized protein
VQAIDWNCPQHIPLKYSEAEVAAKIAPLEARIQELEAKLLEITETTSDFNKSCQEL